MFKMIGGDGREYGPISEQQLREWIGEQRANGQTLLQREGSTEWLPMSAFPEFTDALSAAWPGPSPVLAPPVPVTPGPEAPIEAEWLGPDRPLDVGGCLGRGWMLLGQHFPRLIGACALVWAITFGTAFIPCAGAFIGLAISGALYGGLALVFLRSIRSQPTGIGEVFACFGPAFVVLLLIWVISGLLGGLGLLLCLIPGLVLKVIWAFAVPLAADRGLAFWPAMETSRRTVMRQFLPVATLLFVAWLPLIVFEGYSILRTSAYLREIVGPISGPPMDSLLQMLEAVKSQAEEITAFALRLELQGQVVLLLNLPFATAAAMYGYESLFGRRRSEGH